jgi:excisionase family DNA binding protein
LQAVRKTGNRSERDLQFASPDTRFRKDFVSGVCLENRLKAGGLGAGGEALLSVKQVAKQLGVSTATVYGLCADGRLAHVRILNVIRVAPVDLAAFVASQHHPVRPRP